MNKTAEDLISGHVIYVNESEDLAKAWHTMQNNSIRHLVVVDDEHKMVGILSDRDCLRATESQSIANARGRVVESRFPENIFVNEFMRAPVKTIEYDLPADQIADLMNEFKISSLVVLSAGRIIGVVTQYDLLKDYSEVLRSNSR